MNFKTTLHFGKCLYTFLCKTRRELKNPFQINGICYDFDNQQLWGNFKTCSYCRQYLMLWFCSLTYLLLKCAFDTQVQTCRLGFCPLSVPFYLCLTHLWTLFLLFTLLQLSLPDVTNPHPLSLSLSPSIPPSLSLSLSLSLSPSLSPSLSLPPRWPSGKASASRAEDPGFESRLRRDFSEVESYQWLKKLALHWLPCQAPGVIGSALGLVGPVSVYCDWVR